MKLVMFSAFINLSVQACKLVFSINGCLVSQSHCWFIFSEITLVSLCPQQHKPHHHLSEQLPPYLFMHSSAAFITSPRPSLLIERVSARGGGCRHHHQSTPPPPPPQTDESHRIQTGSRKRLTCTHKHNNKRTRIRKPSFPLNDNVHMVP